MATIFINGPFIDPLLPIFFQFKSKEQVQAFIHKILFVDHLPLNSTNQNFLSILPHPKTIEVFDESHPSYFNVVFEQTIYEGQWHILRKKPTDAVIYRKCIEKLVEYRNVLAKELAKFAPKKGVVDKTTRDTPQQAHSVLAPPKGHVNESDPFFSNSFSHSSASQNRADGKSLGVGGVVAPDISSRSSSKDVETISEHLDNVEQNHDPNFLSYYQNFDPHHTNDPPSVSLFRMNFSNFFPSTSL